MVSSSTSHSLSLARRARRAPSRRVLSPTATSSSELARPPPPSARSPPPPRTGHGGSNPDHGESDGSNSDHGGSGPSHGGFNGSGPSFGACDDSSSEQSRLKSPIPVQNMPLYSKPPRCGRRPLVLRQPVFFYRWWPSPWYSCSDYYIVEMFLPLLLPMVHGHILILLVFARARH